MKTVRSLAAAFLILAAPAPASSRPPVEAPRPPVVRELPPPVGWTTPATVVSVYDADTITVTVTRQFRVRVIGVYAPEVRTRDREEKARGIAARDWLRGQLPAGTRVILHVPASRNAGDAWSLSRLLARVWKPGDDRPIARRVIEAGHGTPPPPGKP